MRRRYERLNIPTKLSRALVLVSETGSITRAAEVVGLTQPAMTAQIKRFEAIVGTELFERGAGGFKLTQIGRLVLDQSRALLEANDRIMALAGSDSDTEYRVGISPGFLEPFLEAFLLEEERPALQIKCLPSNAIAASIADGHVDVAMLLLTDAAMAPIAEWQEAMIWVKSPDLAIDPSRPIPLVAWPSKFADTLMLNTLESHGLEYSFVVVSSDFQSRITATRLGLGVMAILERTLVKNLDPVPPGILPPLPQVRAGICLRRGLRERHVAAVTAAMRRAFAKEIASGDAGQRRRALASAS